MAVQQRDSFTSKSPGTKPIGCHHGLTIIDVLGYRGISGVQNGGSTRTIYIYLHYIQNVGFVYQQKLRCWGGKTIFHHPNCGFTIRMSEIISGICPSKFRIKWKT